MTLTNEASGPFSRLYQKENEIRNWRSLYELLLWDESTYLPPSAVGHRAEVKAYVATQLHTLFSSEEMGRAVEDAGRLEIPEGSWEAADLREWRKRRKRSLALPIRLVSDLAQATTGARNAWLKAKAENRFVDFIEPLKRVIVLKQEEADCLAGNGHGASHLIEPLIQEWEPGMKIETLERLFSELKDPMVKLLSAIMASGVKRNEGILRYPCPLPLQQNFTKDLASRIGFEFLRGRIDTAAHPFCMRLGPNDIRLTTRYDENHFSQSFFTVLHEAGHGLYEQGLPPEHFHRPSGGYCSLGIHESQSRLWENAVGRSGEFWSFMFPLVKKAYGGWANTPLKDFVLAINQVRPSLIRVESDEVTYNLHIMIRYEIECDLIAGKLEARHLAERWNEGYRTYLGVVPTTDSEGCLQDIHWSYGMFGYFPTYTLGNLYAAQFLRQAETDLPGLRERFAEGRFSELKLWLKENIHSEGARESAGALCQKVTGRGLSTEPFLTYLNEKFATMYGLR